MKPGISHSIIGPAHPGAFHALMACQRELGAADRALFPWELLAESQVVFDASLKATRKFLDLHGTIEHVHVFTRPGFGQVAGRLVDALYEYAKVQHIPIRIRLEMLNCNGEVPSATVFTCGDGREVFWRTLEEIHARFGTPRVFAVPGEEQWLRNNPGVASQIEGWLSERPRVPRVVVKHGGPPRDEHGYSGCGYRRVAHEHLAEGSPAMERELALAECYHPDTEYLWAPGHGPDLLQGLRSASAC